MAAVHGHLGDEAPSLFRHAVESLHTARLRPEIRLEEVGAPRRLAAYAHALEATVVSDGEELAEGRLVLLHEPGGQEAWHGDLRVVTLARAELEPEIAGDPLLPEVSWSWLTGALAARGAEYAEPSGTVSRASSHYFGGLGDRPDDTQIEIRASWTPREAGTDRERNGGGDRGREIGAQAPDLAAHLAAWCDLLCACAGLPPSDSPDEPDSAEEGGGVVPLPKRRG
ncbi:DUF3000 domain-containing protein [Actinacidiphila acididurans]|uniref:DUF3000 domain-containing protein n=1 Tax=Actinacidiphila acididurans TaxID=2784346 RepID=A0ABS2TVL8_9ACTN|nr:DUF3000 domain-containing protein [Actinacidiphila acididurans]MBM9507366.1 DUF3000 domain-containing protein [Actinacidiphila acididurans]